VSEHRPDVTKPGKIVTSDGTEIGEHRGLVHHTVGQRRGIGIAAKKPYFVLHLDTSENRLVVGSREEAAARQIEIADVSMISGTWPEGAFMTDAVVRYRGVANMAEVTGANAEARTATARFVAERGPIASPGQAVVFYRGDEVLGGGTIANVTREPAS
jgi:tRNA-specific 2-thiouridylase